MLSIIMKTNKRKIFLIIICLSFVLFIENKQIFTDTNSTLNTVSAPDFKSTHIDPSNIPDSIFSSLYHHDSLYFLQDEFESKLSNGEIDKNNLNRYLKIVSWNRDTSVIPIFKTIIEDTTINSYYKALSIYSLGEIGLSSSFDYLVNVFKSKNVLIREYVAGALGKTGSKQNIETIKKLTEGEHDFYVKKSLECALGRIKGGYLNHFTYLPKYSGIGLKKIDFHLNVSKYDTGSYTTNLKSSNIADHKILSLNPIAPHLQFKTNKKFYKKIDYPFKNFGIKIGKDVSHTGEDSGCLFSGMAIHSILEGVVVSIQHDGSWGVLISIQTTVEDGEVVTVHYGHLAHDINVELNQIVKQGDKIGEIGPSLTLQNGGYLSHLHIGIERLPFDQATYSGYNLWGESFYDPMKLIFNRDSL